MCAKYFVDQHPISVQLAKGSSHCWKALQEIKNNTEEYILWKLGTDDVSFSFDNWSNLGPLYLITSNVNGHTQIKLNSILKNGSWEWNSLQTQPNVELKNKIISLGIVLGNNEDDTTIGT